MSDYKWVRRNGVDQWVHLDVLFDAPYGFAKNCPDCPPPDSTIPEDQIQKPIDPDEVLARIAGQKRDDDAWRRQDGTKYESAVEELNAVWGKGPTTTSARNCTTSWTAASSAVRGRRTAASGDAFATRSTTG